MATPYEDLQKANGDYHEAFDEMLKEEVVPVEIKAKLGGYGDSIFILMSKINTILEEYYG